MSNKELAPSNKSGAKLLFAAFKILKASGGQLPGREVAESIGKTVNFTDWEKEKYEKTGNYRWWALLHFFSIDAVKAGFLRKNKGIWILTPEGESAMQLGETELLQVVRKAYKKWREENVSDEEIIDGPASEEKIQKATLEQLEDKAIEGLKEYIKNKNPYEFQDLVAALMRAMGYYTPFVSPKGRDGGVDVIAYQDPIGVKSPRIKIQVKHKPDSTIPVDDIRSLLGVLNKEGDVGMLITTGRFTTEAERFSRDSRIHIELVDFDRFISLWQEFYHKMNDEDKNLLPLQPLYFLGTNE